MPEIQRTVLDGRRQARPAPAVRVHPVSRRRPVVLEAVVTESPAPDAPMDAVTLWIGALATALVCGLVSIAGVIAARALPGVRLIGPHEGSYGPVVAWHLTAGTVVAVLLAALLVHLLLLLSPRPLLFFRCVALLLTATMAMWPFTTGADSRSALVSAAVYAAIGLSVTGLLTTVSRHSGTPRDGLQ